MEKEKEGYEKMEKVKGTNEAILVQVVEDGASENCYQVIKNIDVAIGFCPFCGKDKLSRDDEMEFVCGHCGSIFFVDKEMDPTGGNIIINVDEEKPNFMFLRSVENAIGVLSEMVITSTEEMGISKQYPDEEIKDYHLLHAMSILRCWFDVNAPKIEG